MPFLLETTRLILRGWDAADLEAFHSICSDPRVMQYVGDGQPWSLDTTRRFIERASEMSRACGYCQWPLIYKSNSALIGFCGFVPAGDGVEMGWRLAQDYWGRGLATEAARRVLTHGFETLAFNRVIATVQAANQGSLRVVEKLGMTLETFLSRNGREVLAYSVIRRPDKRGGTTS